MSKFLGLWLPFSLGVGHLLGFLTWAPFYFKGFNLISTIYNPYGINEIFIAAPVLGFILTFLVQKI